MAHNNSVSRIEVTTNNDLLYGQSALPHVTTAQGTSYANTSTVTDGNNSKKHRNIKKVSIWSKNMYHARKSKELSSMRLLKDSID